jgi:predicted alpha/beta-fold hydrolase
MRRELRWTLPAEDVIVDVGDGVRLLLRASWQTDAPQRPTVLLLHGLGASDAGTYTIAAGAYAWSRGWNVVRMNMRGAGDAEALSAHLYHAGLDTDLVAALHAVAERTPRVAVVGFSLGASITLLALARQAGALPPGLIGAAAVSPPLDLEACARAIEAPGNRIYLRYFMIGLRDAYQRRQRLLPHLYEAGREQGVRSVVEYDAAITAPYGGFRDVLHYYGDSSAGPRLAQVRHPALLLAAMDDPLIPAESVTRFALPASGVVRREMMPTGGHVGFVAPTAAPGWFWAGERAIAFLESVG